MLPVPMTKRTRESHDVPRGHTQCTCGGGMLMRIRKPAK